MAGGRSFTSEELISAIKQLKSRKQAISGSSLRALVGKGRPSALIAAYQSLVSEGALEGSDEEHDNPVVPTKQLPPQAAELKQQLIESIETLVLMISDSAHASIEKEYLDWIAVAKNESNQLASQIEQLHHELETAYNDVEDAKETIEASDLACQKSNASLLESRAELEKVIKIKRHLEQEQQQLQQALASTQKQLNASTATAENASAEMVKLRTQLKEKTTQLEALEQSRQQRQQRIEDQQQRIGQLESHLAQETSAKTQLSQTNLELNKQVTRAIDKDKAVSQELYHLQHRNTELKAELAAYKQEAEQLKEAVTISIANERNVAEQLADLRLKNQQQEKALKLCEQELHTATGIISALQTEVVE